MSNFKNYSKGRIALDSAFLGELKNYSVTSNSNHQDVFTLERGLSGKSNGAPTVDVKLSMVCPKEGLEVDLEDPAMEGEIRIITLELSGDIRSYEGWFTSVEFTGGVDQAAEYTANFRGNKL